MIPNGYQILKIFISHKSIDYHLIYRFTKILSDQEYDPNLQLEFIFSEMIEPGINYRSKIDEELATSKLLFMFNRDSQDEKDWCIYEAAYFKGCHRNHPECRIVSFTHKEKNVPTPLNNLQIVKIDKQSLKQFLIWFYGNEEILSFPVNKVLSLDELKLESKAEDIWVLLIDKMKGDKYEH